MPVGVIGLGKVGSGIATTLIDAGYDVIGYDIDESALTSAEQAGVDAAAHSEEVARNAHEIILSLPDPAASRTVVDTVVEHGMSDTVIFDTSTISPVTATELRDRGTAEGVRYHDCPITGGALGARRGELTMLIGGDVQKLRDHRDLLTTITEEVYHIGDVGDAQYVKLIHNHVGISVLVIFIEGLLLGEQMGVDPAVLYRTLRHYTNMYDDKLDNFFGNNFREHFEEHFALDEDAVRYGLDQRFNLSEAHKDISELESLAEEYATPLLLGDTVEQVHRLGVGSGYGSQPHPHLLEMFEDLLDVEIESTAENRGKSKGKLFER